VHKIYGRVSSHVRPCTVYTTRYHLVRAGNTGQRSAIEFCVRLRKPFVETYPVTQQAFGDEALHPVLLRIHGGDGSIEDGREWAGRRRTKRNAFRQLLRYARAAARSTSSALPADHSRRTRASYSSNPDGWALLHDDAPGSPGLAPADYFRFPALEFKMKGHFFNDIPGGPKSSYRTARGNATKRFLQNDGWTALPKSVRLGKGST